MCTLHGRLRVRRGQEVDHMGFVCPPAIINSTSSEHLLRVIQERLPSTLDVLKAKCRSALKVVLSSDSASSCLRLGRHLGALSAFCRMHQHCLALLQPMKAAGIMSSMYCTALLMRRIRTKNLLNTQLSIWVMKPGNFSVVFEPPPPEQTAHVESAFTMMESLVASRLVDPEQPAERMRKLKRLTKFCSSFRGPGIQHYCPPGRVRERATSI